MGQKVEVGVMSLADYRAVFDAVCAAHGLTSDDAGFDQLLHLHARAGPSLLACYPRDLITLATSRATYLGIAPRAGGELLDWAWHVYFGSQPATPSTANEPSADDEQQLAQSGALNCRSTRP
jgi:hypothetical protein